MVITKEEGLELFADNPFKLSILTNKVADGSRTTVYRCGDLIDLCRGPHVAHTGKVKAFATTRHSATNWLGDTENDSLQRMYGISFPDKKMLKVWKENQEKVCKILTVVSYRYNRGGSDETTRISFSECLHNDRNNHFSLILLSTSVDYFRLGVGLSFLLCDLHLTRSSIYLLFVTTGQGARPPTYCQQAGFDHVSRTIGRKCLLVASRNAYL
jgi:hypothetical protein